MKGVFFVLLALNLLLGVWLWLGGPLDQVHEPSRLDLQLQADRFHRLSDEDLARLRAQAPSPSPAPAAAPAPAGPPGASAGAPPAGDSPPTNCLLIVNLPSEALAKKIRARLSDLPNERVRTEGDNGSYRLRLREVDEATEARVRRLVREYPRLSLEHCTGAAPATGP